MYGLSEQQNETIIDYVSMPQKILVQHQLVVVVIKRQKSYKIQKNRSGWHLCITSDFPNNQHYLDR